MTTIGDEHQNSTFQRYCQTKKVASRETKFVGAIYDATQKSRDAMLCVKQRQHAGTKGLYGLR